MAKLISGKEVAAHLNEETVEKINRFKEKHNKDIALAVIIVGDDPASKVYVRNKKRSCEKLGIKSVEYALPGDTTQKELLELVKKLNDDAEINGILCQLPLPKHLNEDTVINAIAPEKDVDCFHPQNVGRLYLGDPVFLPCTPAGVMEMLKYENIEVKGKTCVVIGRSNIVGKPMAALLLSQSGTVTVCHSKTADIKTVASGADILVAAVGRANFVTADMVKDGAVVIDVGINRLSDGTLCGDVKFDEVEPKCSYITPVPGGVGPMTISYLMKNTVTAAELQNENN